VGRGAAGNAGADDDGVALRRLRETVGAARTQVAGQHLALAGKAGAFFDGELGIL
jgi:hypothetical protein